MFHRILVNSKVNRIQIQRHISKYHLLQRNFSNAIVGNPELKDLSPSMAAKAKKIDLEYRSKHFSMPEIEMSENEADNVRRKRLIYRSKQRGYLEVDLILGNFAMEHGNSLTTSEMDQYEDIINQETLDIYNYVTAKTQVPAWLDTPMMKRLQKYALESDPTKFTLDEKRF
mmetsp:Transcript_20083/g.25957  ORF Transcript_20083/g.25957 Transcript_20083/m.25957 type:complete len:171 (-) Transcript_20083:542-1054(-)